MRSGTHNHLEEIETEATVEHVGADGNRLQQPKRLSGSATPHDAPNAHPNELCAMGTGTGERGVYTQ